MGNPVPPQAGGPSGWLSLLPDKKPDPTNTGKYFKGEKSDALQPGLVPVCVPAYNEEADELISTLRGLCEMQYALREVDPNLGQCKLEVLIVVDGWGKASKSMKELLLRLFPPERFPKVSGATWVDRVRTAGPGTTAILQNPGETDLTEMDLSFLKLNFRKLRLSCVIKVDNRKKYNSHDWFFRGFCAHLNAEFAFATDCGTLFERDCLGKLMQKMRANPRCVAATGRQRVMTQEMQPGCEREHLGASLLRAVQGFDFEASTVLFYGAFSLSGTLPVIPGPCGLFRMPPLLAPRPENLGGRSALDFYFATTSETDATAGLLQGNLVLAEDRVLTLAAAFFGDAECNQTLWEPAAVFYFQAETELKKLVAQRRRWINGTIAGYLYAHSELGTEEMQRRHGFWRIWRTRRLIETILLVYMGISACASLFVFGFWEAMRFLSSSAGRGEGAFGHGAELGISFLYFGVFVGFLCRHHIEEYDQRVFAVLTLVNAMATAAMVTGFCVGAWSDWGDLHLAALFYLVMPFLLNMLIPDYQSMWLLLRQLVPYLLFLPTMVGGFTALAFARTFDLSWGNRPDELKLKRDQEMKLKRESQTIMVVQVTLNLLLTILAVYFHHTAFSTRLLGGLLLVPSVVLAAGSLHFLLGKKVFFLGFLACAGEAALELNGVWHAGRGAELTAWAGLHPGSAPWGPRLLILFLVLLPSHLGRCGERCKRRCRRWKMKKAMDAEKAGEASPKMKEAMDAKKAGEVSPKTKNFFKLMDAMEIAEEGENGKATV